MRNRTFFRLIGASIVLVGLALGVLLIGQSPALASRSTNPGAGPTNQQKYCEIYVHALASRLKVTVAQLAAANKSALQTTIQQAHTDGAITQAQETKLLDKIKQLSSDPCADLARAAQARHMRLAAARQAVVTAVAGALKLPPATLEKDLSSGLTIPAIASSQNVSLDSVNAVYLAAIQTQLKEAVANGTITQAQSDKAYTAIQRAVASGKYPLLDTHASGGSMWGGA